MPVERFYTPQDLTKDSLCTLEEQEFHHLRHVIRCKLGERVELVNGRGVLAEASIEEIGKRSIRLRLLEIFHATPPAEIILAQAIPRMNRLEWIIEKGTELGVSSFWLFPGEKSEKGHFSTNQNERMQHLAISAMKQCGRLYLPEIRYMPPLREWDKPTIPILFGDLSPDAPRPQLPMARPVVLVVGPESGLSQEESEFLTSTLQAQGIRLHDNILRTDTAALALLALATYSV